MKSQNDNLLIIILCLKRFQKIVFVQFLKLEYLIDYFSIAVKIYLFFITKYIICNEYVLIKLSFIKHGKDSVSFEFHLNAIISKSIKSQITIFYWQNMINPIFSSCTVCIWYIELININNPLDNIS